MFERFDDKARRAIFFARHEAVLLGSPFIGAEHLLLGVLRESGQELRPLLPRVQLESVRREIYETSPARKRLPNDIDLPLANDTERVLRYAIMEADRLGRVHVSGEHLLIGFLLGEDSLAARLLRDRGVSLTQIRTVLESGLRKKLHEWIDKLSEAELPPVARALSNFQIPAPRPWERRVEPPLLPKTRRAKPTPPAANTTYRDGRTRVFESHRFHEGHEVTIVERLTLSQDGKTLSYEQEVQGPGQERRQQIDFAVGE